MPVVGDRVRVLPNKAGQPTREGVVTTVNGNLLGIRWSRGEETSLIPGPGSVTVIGKVRAAAAKKTSKGTGVSAAKSVKTTKPSPVKKAGKAAKKSKGR